MKILVLPALAACWLALTAGPMAAAAQDPVPASAHENYYAAGERVELTAPVGGDAVVAGRVVTLAQPVAGDVLAAGWRVSLTAPAADDVRMAGREVVVTAALDGDLTVAGGDVAIGRDARVAGRTWVTGGTIRADGVFERDVHLLGRDVVVGGEVRQPLRITAESLRILASANLLAAVTYRGPAEARVEHGARLAVPLAYERIPAAEARQAREARGSSFVLFLLHMSVAGLLFLWLVPRVSTGAARTLRAEPGRSALTGFVLLVTVPVAALLLVVSLLGLPVGLALAALYFVALLLAMLIAAYAVGEIEWRLMKRPPITARSHEALVLVAGVATLAVLRAVPVVGGFVVFAAVLFGLGSLGLWVYRRWSETGSPAPLGA
jgi:hypothetical protein